MNILIKIINKMKAIKNKDLLKDQIIERNNRIENYILNYLSNKNTNVNSNFSITIDNLNKEKLYKSPQTFKNKALKNTQLKIKKKHYKKKFNELTQNSYINDMNNNNKNRNIRNNINNSDSEDTLTMATRKTLISIRQYKDNKENINSNCNYSIMTNNCNYSYMANNTYSNNDLYKNKNFSYINKNNKNINNILWNKNITYFLKKNPKLIGKKNKKYLYFIKNKNNLSISNPNNSKNINQSYKNLIDNSIDSITSNIRKNNFEKSNNNNETKLQENKNIMSREKAKTIDSIKTIKRAKKPSIYVISNNSFFDNFIYNKKNNYSSFSHDKDMRNKTLVINNEKEKNNEGKTAKNINLEDFLLIIQKFENIKSLINSLPEKIKNIKQLLILINSIKIKIYDLYKYYFGCTLEGEPENLFISKKVKINLHYYSIIAILSLVLLYILTNKVKMTQEYYPQIINLFNFQQKLFLLLSDMVIHRIKINNGQKIWAREIMNILNNKLIFNTENYILDMKNIILNSYYLINEILVDLKFKNENGLIDLNEQELFFMNFYFNNSLNSLCKYKIIKIEEIFNNNIFKIYNIKSNYANLISRKNKSYNNININRNKNILNYFKDSFEVIIPPQKEPIKINPKIPYLKFPSKKEFTLIIDLDETIMHFDVIDINKRLGKIQLRPGLINFLEIIKEFYEIIIFSSSTKEYVDTILNVIEKKGNNKYFVGKLYREHNIQIGQKYYKDLSKIGRDLSRTIIVDNLNNNYKFQKQNGILISSFYGENKEDKALIELQKILIKIYNEKCDVRKSINKYKEEIFRKVSFLNK